MKCHPAAALALTLVVASADAPLSEGQKVGEVIWADEAHSRVSFVPASLLYAQGSWEGDEMPTLSGIGLLDEEVETLRENVRAARGPGQLSTADRIAENCPGPEGLKSRTAPDGTYASKPLADWLRDLGGRAYVARASSMEPGWSPTSSSVLTLVRFAVVTPIAGVETGTASEEVAVFGGFGWLHLGSATLCREEDPVLSGASLGDEYFIWEGGGRRDGPIAHLGMILPANSDSIDTTSCKFCGGESSVSLTSLRSALDRR
jgi:hypothetical protein